MSVPEVITIDSVRYIRSVIKPPIVGNRVIVVVDRGWVFAGDCVRENGRIKLSRALHVSKWESVGFAGIIEHTKNAVLRPIADVDIPEQSEIFCVPVKENWGL